MLSKVSEAQKSKVRRCLFGKRKGTSRKRRTAKGSCGVECNQRTCYTCTKRCKRKPIILYDEYARKIVKMINNVPLAKLPILCKVTKPHVPAVKM